MAKKIKLTRKQIKQPDEFLSWTEEAWQWLEENWMVAIGAIAGVILAALIFRLGITWYKMNQGSSSLEFSKAEDIMLAQVSKSNTPDSLAALFNRGPNYSSYDERNKAAAESFKKIADEQKNTLEGQLSLLHLGALSEKLGDETGAIAYYDGFLKTKLASQAPEFKQEALLGKARANYEQKNYDASITILQDLINSDTTFKQAAMLMLARSYHRAGKVDDAKKTLDQLNKDFPDQNGALPADFLLAYWDQNKPAEPPPPPAPTLGGSETAPPTPDDLTAPPPMVAPESPEGEGATVSEPAPEPEPAPAPGNTP